MRTPPNSILPPAGKSCCWLGVCGNSLGAAATKLSKGRIRAPAALQRAEALMKCCVKALECFQIAAEHHMTGGSNLSTWPLGS